jgi:hypothetical protein
MKYCKILLPFFVLIFFSCGKKIDEPEVTILWEKSNITTDRQISDTVYFEGIIRVSQGAKLTIDPGTTIIFKSEVQSALIVEPGCRIEANGTVEKPITLTADVAKEGAWGGLIILGRAPVTSADLNIPSDGFLIPNFTYGGDFPNDNSGFIKYTRIWYAGGSSINNLQTTSVFNGLTLCGVGSGTTIDFVHVHKSARDAFAVYGGTVNLRHIVATGSKDDGIYSNEGWNGDVQFYIAQMNNLTSGNGVEIDNNQELGTFKQQWLDGSDQCFPFRGPNFNHITIIGDELNQSPPGNAICLFSGGHGYFQNAIILGFENSKPLNIGTDGSSTYFWIQHSQIQFQDASVKQINLPNTTANEDSLFFRAWGNDLSTYQIKAPFDISAPDFSAVNFIDGYVININNPCVNPFFTEYGIHKYKGAVGNNSPIDPLTSDWTKNWIIYP